MTVECWNALLLTSSLGFVLGGVLGKVLEAWAWRVSAADYRKRESGGRLYVVREERGLT